jgi:hypothetical protein
MRNASKQHIRLDGFSDGKPIEDIQVRQRYWAIGEFVGKGDRVRTVPVPEGSSCRRY